MTVRTWLYSTLTAPSLPYDAHSRVFAKRSMRSSLEDTPYLVYKLGNDSNNNFSEELIVHSQFFQIYVHDYADGDSADYMKIDEVMAEVKARIDLAESPADGLVQARWLENSQDLNDDTLGTVFKYMRFVAQVRS